MKKMGLPPILSRQIIKSKIRFRRLLRSTKVGIRLRRKSSRLLLLVCVCLIFLLHNAWTRYSHVGRHRIQYPFAASARPRGSNMVNRQRAEAVQNEFRWIFAKYKTAAWGNEQQSPVSGHIEKSPGHDIGSTIFTASVLEALTTALIMNLTAEAASALEYVASAPTLLNAVDGSANAQSLEIRADEITVRNLGALVSAADVLGEKKSVFGPISGQAAYRAVCIRRATELAKILGPAYTEIPSGLRWPRLHVSSDGGSIISREEVTSSSETDESSFDGPKRHEWESQFTTPSEAGVGWMENARLSALTGDNVYIANATRGWNGLVYNGNEDPIEGLIGSPVDIETGYAMGRGVGVDGEHGKYYETLLKSALLAPGVGGVDLYALRWESAMTAAKLHLTSLGTAPESYTAEGERRDNGYIFLSRSDGVGMFYNLMDHSTCAVAGQLCLGGRALGRPDLVDLGLELVDTCRAFYVTPTGLGPEVIAWEPATREITEAVSAHAGAEGVRWMIPHPNNQDQSSQLRRKGFWTVDSRSYLRPDVVASYFYAYRVTGEEIFREWAWTAFLGLRRFARAQHGYGAVSDVTAPDGGGPVLDQAEHRNLMQTMKYLYLIFDVPERYCLDEWIFSSGK
ncbi:glycoside hydrolase [Lipomyces oligophaga]|uniref:glycoside hydrolase n=1 Tax=Lipomyces oligophaga TaxID=45792 RepID=UPI0034CF383F